MRIAFSTVQDETGEEQHEVTGRMPHLINKLQSCLREQGDVHQLLTEAAVDLQVLADFCQEFAIAA